MASLKLVEKFELLFDDEWLRSQGGNRAKVCIRALISARDILKEAERKDFSARLLIQPIRGYAKKLTTLRSFKKINRESEIELCAILCTLIWVALESPQGLALYEEAIIQIGCDKWCPEVFRTIDEVRWQLEWPKKYHQVQ